MAFKSALFRRTLGVPLRLPLNDGHEHKSLPWVCLVPRRGPIDASEQLDACGGRSSHSYHHGLRGELWSMRRTTEDGGASALADCAAHPPERRGEFSDLFGPPWPRPRGRLFEYGNRTGSIWSRDGVRRCTYALHLDRDGCGVLAIGDASSPSAAARTVAMTATTQPDGGRRWWMVCPERARRVRDHVSAQLGTRAPFVPMLPPPRLRNAASSVPPRGAHTVHRCSGFVSAVIERVRQAESRPYAPPDIRAPHGEDARGRSRRDRALVLDTLPPIAQCTADRDQVIRGSEYAAPADDKLVAITGGLLVRRPRDEREGGYRSCLGARDLIRRTLRDILALQRASGATLFSGRWDGAQREHASLF